MAKKNKSSLKGAYPVSEDCPKCGSTDYKRAKPETAVAFADDRICKACGVRYTPPTPPWARIVFAICGLIGLAVGLGIAWISYTSEPMSAKGLGGGLLLAIGVGVGCFYKAFSKK